MAIPVSVTSQRSVLFAAALLLLISSAHGGGGIMPTYTEVNPGVMGGGYKQPRATNIPTVVVTPEQYTEQGNTVQNTPLAAVVQDQIAQQLQRQQQQQQLPELEAKKEQQQPKKQQQQHLSPQEQQVLQQRQEVLKQRQQIAQQRLQQQQQPKQGGAENQNQQQQPVAQQQQQQQQHQQQLLQKATVKKPAETKANAPKIVYSDQTTLQQLSKSATLASQVASQLPAQNSLLSTTLMAASQNLRNAFVLMNAGKKDLVMKQVTAAEVAFRQCQPEFSKLNNDQLYQQFLLAYQVAEVAKASFQATSVQAKAAARVKGGH